MQEIGCSGLVRHLMDVISIFFLVDQIIVKTFKLLFENQPDYVS